MTPPVLDELEHRVWQQLAISCDHWVEERQNEAREAKRRR